MSDTPLDHAIQSTPLLTAAEEIDLARRYAAGDITARDHLVAANLRFCVTRARRWTGRGVDLGDLTQHGVLGLLRAVDLWDPERGWRFLTFASWHIDAKIRKAVEAEGRPIRVPANRGYQLRTVAAICDALDAAQQPVTVDAIMERTGWTAARVESLLTHRETYSLDAHIDADDAVGLGTVADQVADPRGCAEFERVTNTATLEPLLRRLNDQQRQVIDLHYGLTSGQPLKASEVARILGVSRERVRQIKDAALLRLRAS